ncbi:MAG: ABC transporter substrate-binding protein [Thermomicrobiales bacterium]
MKTTDRISGSLTPTRRDMLKFVALAGAGAGLVSFTGPLARTAAAFQDEPKPGGTLNVGVAAELKVLDPHITTLAAYATTLRFTIFETLVEVDETGTYIPSLADSWELAEDGLSLTLNLAQNATFHNGKDFTADDVIFTINRIKDPALSSQFAPQVQNVSDVEAVDDHTVVLKFSAPTPAILDYLLNVQIVTQQDIEGIGEKPIGTGPFEFSEWVLNDHITVKKFADYRVEGLPYLDEIVFRPILDADTRLTNLQAGSLDLVEQPAAKDAERIKADAALQLIVTPPTSKYDNIQINTQNPLMSDAKVRQAMSFAFDRESYVRDILYGFGTPAVGPFPTSNWAYDATIIEPFLVFDLEKAGKLLEEAGHAGGQGLEGIEILTPLGYPEIKAAAVLLQANLAALGINATVSELEIAAWVDRIATKPDYVMTTDTYGYGDVDPSTFFTRDNLNPDTNIHQFKNEEYAKLVQEGASTVDQEKRKEIYAKIQQILMDEMPGFLIAHKQDLFAAKANVVGFNPGPLIRHHYEKTWIK